MRITALNRGGLAVFQGHYDPHRDEAIITVHDGETRTLVIEYPSVPSSVSASGDGITATSPTVSGNKATTTLSGLDDGGSIDITATVQGQIRTVRIRATVSNTHQSGSTGGVSITADDGSIDYGSEDGSIFLTIM